MQGSNGDAQDGIEDCKVIAGYGIVTTGLAGSESADVLAAWDTIECSVGQWSAGGALNTTCTTCTGYRTTNGTGKAQDADCNCEFPQVGSLYLAGCCSPFQQ